MTLLKTSASAFAPCGNLCAIQPQAAWYRFLRRGSFIPPQAHVSDRKREIKYFAGICCLSSRVQGNGRQKRRAGADVRAVARRPLREDATRK